MKKLEHELYEAIKKALESLSDVKKLSCFDWRIRE